MEVTPDEKPESTAPPQVPSDRDVAQVDPAQYPARELTRIRDLRGQEFQVVMTRSALNDMHRHGRSQRDRWSGRHGRGVLVLEVVVAAKVDRVQGKG